MFYKNILNFGVYDFLNYCKTNSGYRYVGLITDKQMTSLSSNSMPDHWELMSNLGNAVFPDVDCSYEDGDLEEYISIFGITGSINILLPDSLSSSQYALLLKIIDEIKKYEEENGIFVFEGDYTSFLELAKAKIVDRKSLESIPNEVLLGVSLEDLVSGNRQLTSTIIKDYEKEDDSWSDWEADWYDVDFSISETEELLDDYDQDESKSNSI